MIMPLKINKSIKTRLQTNIVFCIFALFISLTACKKDKSVVVLDNYVTAEFDGVAVKFNIDAYAKKVVMTDGGFTVVQGADERGNTLGMSLSNIIAAGKTYTSSDPENHTNLQYYDSAIDGFYLSDNRLNLATAKLTKISDKRLEGTFSGTISGHNKTIIVTNGKFGVNYVVR
jgi:hypothetical protein